MKCKLDLVSWVEVPSAKWLNCQSGRLALRLSEPAAVYATDDGVETLIGYDSDFEVLASAPFEFWVEPGPRVFVYQGVDAGCVSSGQLLANVERLPMESGSLYEVKRALRLQQFERRELMKEMRAEADKVRQLRATLRAEVAASDPSSAAVSSPAPSPAAASASAPEPKPEKGEAN